MSKFIRFTISIFLSLALTLSYIPTAFAGESTPDEAEGLKTVLRVTADEITESNFSTAVQRALDTARNEASAENVFTVEVEQGEYMLTRGLKIFDNTTLSLYGVTLKRAQGAYINMLRIGNEDSASRGAEGYYYKNIAIEGGVFDADNTPQTMIKAAHAENFSMKDVFLKNAENSHMMEVAGVDGFSVINCVFENQYLDRETASDLCYEAIQLDVLKSGHIVNCRSEDLAMRNIVIQGCSFKNVPRGVGSHTAVLNNPLENITIKNNTFINMGSAAIQSLGWMNCTIIDNYIENTPRGIAIYQVGTEGKGTFLASVLAEEGGTEAHVSDEYITPADSKTLIAYNVIKKCGYVEDVYANYKPSAISAIGADFAEVYPNQTKGSAGLPIGDYFLKGVTIKNNYVEVKGTGCRLSDVKNVEVSSNVFICGDNEFSTETTFYGILAKDKSNLTSVVNNSVKNAKISGIHFGEGCEVNTVTYNKINTASKLGIACSGTKINTLTDNTVTNIASEGIGIKNNSVVKNPIVRNKISNCATGANITNNLSGIFNSNTITKCKTPLKYSKTQMKRIAANNYSYASDVGTVMLGVSSLEISAGKNYKLSPRTVPLNSDSVLTYSSSDTAVAEADEFGFITAKSPGTAKITAKSPNGKTASVEVKVTKDVKESKAVSGSAISYISSLYNYNDGVYMQWGKIDKAVKYRVYRKTTGSYARVADVTSLSYIDKAVSSGITYTYTVRAIDSKGAFIGSYDGPGAKITYVAAAKISKITNTDKNVKVEWNSIPGASMYRLFYKVGNGSWVSWGTTSKTSKIFSTVQSGGTYYFAVISTDSNKESLNVCKISPGRMFLSKPSIKLVKRSKKGKKVRLSWTKVNGAKKYILSVLQTKVKVKKYSKKKKKYVTKLKDNTKWKTLKKTSATSVVCSGIYDITYQYYVRCTDSSGKSVSVNSGILSVTYKKPEVKKKEKKVKVNR